MEPPDHLQAETYVHTNRKKPSILTKYSASSTYLKGEGSAVGRRDDE
jgi:hypothetical protein